MNENTVIVAMRVEDAVSVVRGSARGRCDLCGAEVWVAPSSIRTDIPRVWCLPCALERIQPDTVWTLAPGFETECLEVIESERGCEPWRPIN